MRSRCPSGGEAAGWPRSPRKGQARMGAEGRTGGERAAESGILGPSSRRWQNGDIRSCRCVEPKAGPGLASVTAEGSGSRVTSSRSRVSG